MKESKRQTDPTIVFEAYSIAGEPVELAFDLRMVWYIHWKDRGGDEKIRWEATIWNKHDHDYMELLMDQTMKMDLISQWRAVLREEVGITGR